MPTTQTLTLALTQQCQWHCYYSILCIPFYSILFHSIRLLHYTFTRMIIWFDSTVRANRLGIPFFPIFFCTHREMVEKKLRNSSLIAIICHPLMRGTFFPFVQFLFVCSFFSLSLCVCVRELHVFFPLPTSLSCSLCSDNISANTLKPCASIKKIKLSRVIYSNADVLRSHIVCMPIDRLTFYWESLQTTAHI